MTLQEMMGRAHAVDYNLAMKLGSKWDLRAIFDGPSTEYKGLTNEERLEALREILMKLDMTVYHLRQPFIERMKRAGHDAVEANDVFNMTLLTLVEHIVRP